MYEGNYEKKQVECLKCGRITQIPKAYTLKESWCKECGSLKIRIYRGDQDTTHVDDGREIQGASRGISE